jgi:hypothetical protein
VAKAAPWPTPDAEVRKRGEQTGLDTLVVHAVNHVNWVLVVLHYQCRSKRVKLTAWGLRPQG